MGKIPHTRVELDGYKFDSKAEARRYQELKLLAYNGDIENLEVHPSFDLMVLPRDDKPEVRVGKYTADFQYWDKEKRKFIVEDVKGGSATKTEAYMLRKRMVEAMYGIEVVEVQA